jgi:hypothetical protein
MDLLEQKERANACEVANVCSDYFNYMSLQKREQVDPVAIEHVNRLRQARLTDAEKKQALGVFDSLFAVDFRFLEYNAEQRKKKSGIR